MSRDRRFFAGLVGVAAIVTWLVWTGISDTMVYYLTPAELMERAESAPEMMEQGVKVSGDVLPGSYAPSSDELLGAGGEGEWRRAAGELCSLL